MPDTSPLLPFGYRPLQPFGVEIEHDLSEPLSPAQGDRLRALLAQHGLILARGQSLSPERHAALLSWFGPPLKRAGEQGYITTEDPHDAARAGG